MSMPTPSPEYLYALMHDGTTCPGGFIDLMDIHLTRLELDYAEGEMTVSHKTNNYMGNVHGGALLGFADTVTGLAAASRGNSVVTVECDFHYLNPGRGDKLFCRATAEKTGRTLRVFRAEVTDGEGAPVAAGTFTFFDTGRSIVPYILGRVAQTGAALEEKKEEKTCETDSSK